MTSETPPPTGSYEFTDRSVLRPWVTQVWFSRLFPLLPRWLAANLVTLLSTGTLGAIVVGSLFADRLGPTKLALLQLLALQLYVAGDHLDGMQAKASGTTSPLGDFLDHHCDLWAGCVLVFGYWSLAGNAPLWVLYAMTIILISSFAITYAERAEQKRLHFTAWGTLEVIAILTAFYVAWMIPPVRTFLLLDLAPGLPRHLLVAGLGTSICLGAIVVIARRLKRLPLPLLLNVVTLIGFAAWCLTNNVTPLWGWALIALVGADYVARLMHAHTTTVPRPWPDLVAPAGLLILWFSNLGDVGPQMLLVGASLWLVVRYAWTLTRIISGWRRHWVWVNAPGGTAP